MITITINSKIHLFTRQLRISTANQIKEMLTFSNPEYWSRMRMRRSLWDAVAGRPVPKEIIGWRELPNQLLLPRGWISDLTALLDGLGEEYEIVDRTRLLPPVDFKFTGTLKVHQAVAVKEILARRFGTVCSPTGSGKTVMGLYVIARRRQPTCIAVHTGKLVKQWAERVTTFLDVTPDEIGYISEGKVSIGKRITIALIQTLCKHAGELAPSFGFFVSDECHHSPASTLFSISQAMDCQYMLGLSATHKRRDGKARMIYWAMGPLVSEVKLKTLVDSNEIIMVKPVIRQTNFVPEPDMRPEQMITALTRDEGRNRLIVGDIEAELAERGGPCIVLTDRTEHCDVLGGMCRVRGLDVAVAHGKLAGADQDRALSELSSGVARVLIATGQLLGEGFDERGLSALFLTCPISFSGRLEQYLGRIMRTAPGKVSAIVYDYADINCDVAMRAFRELARTYRRLQRQAGK